MKVLELFAGARCIGRAAEKLGYEVFSIDWTAYEGIDLQIDIEFLKPSMIPMLPDHVHLSPDCTSYSISAISHHRKGTTPVSEYAFKSDRVIMNCIELIQHYTLLNPNLTYSFENPRGMLRKMPFMQQFPRHTVWYCQYGDDRAKPTDIWTNLNWVPKPVCHNGNKNCHHQPAPRGSATGTQGRKNAHHRSMMPELLCSDLMESAYMY